MAKIRAFIAINLPESLKKEISKLIENFKIKNPSQFIKLVSPNNLHLTLHFLGYLEEKKLNLVKEILSQMTKKLESFSLEIGEIGGFPDLFRPRVLFISLKEADDKLKNFQAELGQALEKIGIPVDKRPWQAHITLARIKNSKVKIRIPKYEIKHLKFKVFSIDLMKSELFPQGPQYTILEKFSLSPSL